MNEFLLGRGLVSRGMTNRDYAKLPENKKKDLLISILYDYYQKKNKLEENGYMIVKLTALVDTSYENSYTDTEFDFFILSKIPVATCEDVVTFINQIVDDNCVPDSYYESPAPSSFFKELLAEIVPYYLVKEIVDNKVFHGYGRNGSFDKKISEYEINRLKSKYAETIKKVEKKYIKNNEGVVIDKLLDLDELYSDKSKLNNKYDSIEVITFKNIMSHLPNLFDYYEATHDELFSGVVSLEHFLDCRGGRACFPESMRGLNREELLEKHMTGSLFARMEEDLGVDFAFLYESFMKYFDKAKGYRALLPIENLPDDINDAYQSIIPELFSKPLNNYEELVEYCRTYDSIFSYLRGVLKEAQEYFSKRQLIDENTKSINEVRNSYNDVVDPYQNYLSQIDMSLMSWKPGETKDKLLPIVQIQNEVLDFISVRQSISENNTRINNDGSQFSDVLDNYKTYFSQVNMSWKSGETKDKLLPIVKIQNEVLDFISVRQSISENNTRINNDGSQFSDVLDNYKTYFSQVDMSWKTGDTKDELQPIIEQQEKCMSFINGRKQIVSFNNEILSKEKIIKNILKIYSDYMNKQDLSWKMGDDVEKINPIIARQQILLEILDGLESDKIKEIDKLVKKQKLTNIDEALSLLNSSK